MVKDMRSKASGRDTLSQEGAHHLARIIREYWFKRGVGVQVWAEQGQTTPQGMAMWVVRSNIIAGGFRDPVKGS